MRNLIWIFLLLLPNLYALDITHHKMFIQIEPEQHKIYVEDELSYKNGIDSTIKFSLHGNLELQVQSPGWKLNFLGKTSWQVSGINAYYQELDALFPIHNYELVPTEKNKNNTVKITYQGKIGIPPRSSEEEYVRSFSETPGIIAPEGIYLTTSSLWYPQQKDTMVSFHLEIKQPTNWHIISSGHEEKTKDKHCVIWNCPTAMEEIYLVGGELYKFSQTHGKVEAQVYLHEKDEALVDKYLTATGQYIEMYNKLLGEYPYKKFALVENFWETGYGMPSFTLLGPRIIRFPFILRSSYPHEILHNWWGNGVFVDYTQGNWCEGLTAYLADHLLKEQEGKGAEARRSTLQRYRNFVRSEQDFALSAFQSRHSPATEAVGYGKCLMLFHELRQKLGEDLFIECLQEFYRQFLFKKASFSDIASVFSTVSKQDLHSFFHERVHKVGAPDIAINNVTVVNQNSFKLNFGLEQLQTGAPYQLLIPIAITLEGKKEAFYHKIFLSEKKQTFNIELNSKPLRIDIDPEFDLFRRVDRSEIPTSFGQLFGAENTILVASKPEKYQSVLTKWKTNENNMELVNDSFANLPNNKTVWFLGSEHKHANTLKELFATKHNVVFTNDTIAITPTQKVSLLNNLVVLCTEHPQNEDLAIGWILGEAEEGISAVARKLPHYGKYSYLAFEGVEANNIEKGQWDIIHSQMTHHLTDAMPSMGTLPERNALAELPQLVDATMLKKHVSFLASPELKGRGLGTIELNRAAKYISDYFKKIGLQPFFPDSYFQSFIATVNHPQKHMEVINIAGFIPGTDPRFINEPVIVGAHYDHLGMGWPDVRSGNENRIHPGADDNASGIAVMLEIAKTFAEKPHSLRPIIFIAFSGEEAGRLGSKHFVDSLGNTKPLTMINLDSVGRLEDRELLALGTGTTREWPFICFGCAAVTNVKIKSIPNSEDSSDHSSFWEKGIPAIQLFSGPHIDYHSPTDTVEKLDFDGMVKTMLVLQEMLMYLGGRDTPLTIIGAPDKPENTTQTTKKERRASLGSIPDFAGSENGVKISGTVPGSPAEKAGMQAGDIITHFAGEEVTDLRKLSDLLKQHQPGDKVSLKYLRDGKTYQVEVVLTER